MTGDCGGKWEALMAGGGGFERRLTLTKSDGGDDGGVERDAEGRGGAYVGGLSCSRLLQSKDLIRETLLLLLLLLLEES